MVVARYMKGRFSAFLPAVLLLLLSVVMRGSAGAQIVIDSFVTPQSTAGSPPTFSTVQGNGILGGERDMGTFLSMSINGAAPYRLNVAFPAGLQTAAGGDITYDGVDHNAYSTSFDGLGSVDLTGGGHYDRFRFDFANLSGYWTSTLLIQVRQYHALQGSMGSYYQLNLPQNSGTIEIPFSAFAFDPSAVFSQPVDFHDVGSINLHFETGPGSSFSIGGITAVPEPSSLSLLFFAAVGLWASTVGRRRS